MPTLSARGLAMPTSPIRRLADYAVAAEAAGKTVHYLNIGQPDVPSPDEFWSAVGEARGTLAYSHSAGTAGLREAAASDYRRRGIEVAPDEILVTAGGSEAVQIAFLALLEPGDEVLVVEPFYANYLGFAVAAGARIRPLTARIEDDFALPSPDAIRAALTPRTRAILLCNPSNPTGTAYSPDALRAIAEIATERDLWLMLDEVYRDFHYGDAELLSVLQIPGIEDRTVMIDSASKKFSLCGARIGFLVSRNREVLATALKFGQARLSAPTLDQRGVEACLRSTPATYFDEVRTEYRARRDLLVDRLRAMPGVFVPEIEGAFYAVVRLPVDDADAFCLWMVRDFDHDGHTVLLAPASGFYATPGLGRDEVRIAYVLDRAKLDRAMDALAAGLAAFG